MNISKDKLGKDCSGLTKKRLFLLDMDGTIYKEDTLFAGVRDFINHIINVNGKYVFITNNSSKSVSDYVLKVNKLGITANEENFFTSSQATVLYLKEHHDKEEIYCMGTQSFVNELKNSGINVVTEVSKTAEVVLVGFDTELTSQKIRNTCEMLKEDVAYIATNPDFACPVNFGFVPDCGAICKMLSYAAKKEPIFIGKPEPMMLEYVINESGFTKEETVIIGDRLYTDIASGINAGVTGVCVLSGETKIDEIHSGNIRPDFVFDSVKDIFEMLKN